MDFVASTKLADILTPRAEGDRVNVHVVVRAAEPKPDFDEMQRVIEGTSLPTADRPRDRKE
jgi:hypothetical protein